MSWNGAIEPAKIPQFTGDVEQLEDNATTLSVGAAVFRLKGASVHSEFQGLAAFYETPEADDLFATTKPVATKSEAFADDLEKVATALSDYAAEVRPLAAKLERLKDEAVKFCWSEIAGDDDWREDEDKVARNNELEDEVTATRLAFWAAEIACHNKITALVGGVQLHLSDDGETDCTTYGYTAEVLEQSELPWGNPVEREYTGWAAFRHNLKSVVWDGFIIDGFVGAAKGLGSLVGTEGWDGMKQSWTGLAKLSTGLAVTLSPVGAAYWAMPEDKLPSWMRDSRMAVKETGKALIAYDEWGKNPARAAGAVSFNVITTVATGGAGAAAKSGAAAKAIAAVGKTGRLVDPVTFAVKGSQFAINGGKYAINTGKIGAIKVGDLFHTLKGAGAGGVRMEIPGATSTTYRLADDVATQSVRYADMPEGALPLKDSHGRPAYMDENGVIRDLHHKVLQLPDEVTKARNAHPSTHRDLSSPHGTDRQPVMASARAEDGAAGRPGDTTGGAPRDVSAETVSRRADGASGGFTHGRSASQETPVSGGHTRGTDTGDHVPSGTVDHGAASPGERPLTGHGEGSTGSHGDGEAGGSGHEASGHADNAGWLPEIDPSRYSRLHDERPHGHTTPLMPEQEPRLLAELGRAKMELRDQEAVLRSLRKDPYGASVAELINRGHLRDTENYRKILEMCKNGPSRSDPSSMVPAAHMALVHATELQSRGFSRLGFEFGESTDPWDLDVYTRSADGEIDYAYQLKDVTSKKKLVKNAESAIEQLRYEHMNQGVAILDVHHPMSIIRPGAFKAIEEAAVEGNATVLLRFEDGAIKIPADGSTYP